MRRPLVLVFVLVVGCLSLAACGGDSEEEEEGRGTVACTGSQLSSVRLPDGFPKPEQVVYTKQETTGPTEVVDGYYEGELENAYNEYKSAFESAGYDVLFDELEENDSEISYRGEGRTGQVALRNDCEEDGRVTVHITSRPE